MRLQTCEDMFGQKIIELRDKRKWSFSAIGTEIGYTGYHTRIVYDKIKEEGGRC